MATIVDIAEKCRVSPRTVSRALNTGGYVNEGLRQKIIATAEELDYQRNAIASSFASEKTGNIGFVLCDITLSHPFYFRILEEVEREAGRKGYRLIFSSAEEFITDKNRFPNILKEKVLDGVLLTGKMSLNFLTVLKERCLPIVIIGRYDLDIQVSEVAPDCRQVGYEATKYLFNLGHQKIGVLSGPLAYTVNKDLLDGYKAALQEFGINYDENLIQEDKLEESSVMIERLLKNSSPPTAIFAVNDMIAIKAMEILRNKGIDVPGQISVIGFGDIELSRHVTPRLTSVKLFEHEMAKKAVNKLLDELSGKNSVPSNISTPIELVIRESCCPLYKRYAPEITMGNLHTKGGEDR